VVVGCIDEDPLQGMALTVERKLAIAERSLHLLTTQYGIPERDVIFDPLVFPCGTGDKQYTGSARQTIEGVRQIKKRFPSVHTILGISNVSFGLPNAGREVLNTVFLHKNFEAGLDMAIVNSEKLQRITQIPDEEIKLCEALIDATQDSFDSVLAQFVAHFRTKTKAPTSGVDRKSIAVETRLAEAVVEGSKSGLVEDLEEARQKYDPLGIINGPLMEGMKKVGVLFGNNQLIVAEVLQSAEVMKAAVSYLEQYMAKSDDASKGKMILATVKGDVHDIGKNLVDIILSNNGYKVINLGIKVLPQTLVNAFHEHRPDLIGLSGLLVKSAQEMVVTAQALKEAGVSAPLFVGGAALSEKFTYTKIAPEYGGLVCYARDAMTGLALANQAIDPAERQGLTQSVDKKRTAATSTAPKASGTEDALPTSDTRLVINHSDVKPAPPDVKLHVLDNIDLELVWSYINPMMLYARHLGLKGRLDDLIEKGDEKAIALQASVSAMQNHVLKHGLLQCKAMYQFMRAASLGNTLILFDDLGHEACRFDFPRQQGRENRCLADLVPSIDSGIRDYVGLFVTTCQGKPGESVRKLADELKEKGEYLKSHILHALAIESAEAAAEWLHQKMRAMWGIPDGANVGMRDLFSARYRGKRYSFGYPACPNLEDQATLWTLLEPNKHLGVELTDGFMMDPESSVSALVFHHPQAAYFSTLSESTTNPI
jgi:5-methyltetrahydrofolate--homocysteine methyltransferase